MRITLACALASLLAACGGSTVDVNTTGGDGGATDASKDSSLTDGGNTDGHVNRIPKVHRAMGEVCPSMRGSQDGMWGDGGAPGDCTRDSDCTMGKNGRCLPGFGGPFHLSCSYDSCATDADCMNAACICRSSGTDTGPNFCGSSKSNCRVDADCGAGGYCSPSQSSDAFCFSALSAYFCHTPQDECTDDSDCGMNQPCSYDPTAMHWKCEMLCSPPPP